MVQRVVFNHNGVTAVLVPVMRSGLTLEQIIAKDVPTGATDIAVVDHTDLPASRGFRDAWVNVAGTVSVNRARAEGIFWDRVRVERAPRLAQLDVEVIRALEEGRPTAPLVAQKQKLRDVTTKDLSSLSLDQLENARLDSVLNLPTRST